MGVWAKVLAVVNLIGGVLGVLGGLTTIASFVLAGVHGESDPVVFGRALPVVVPIVVVQLLFAAAAIALAILVLAARKARGV